MPDLDCIHFRRYRKKAKCKSRKEELFMSIIRFIQVEGHGEVKCLSTETDTRFIIGLTQKEIADIEKIMETEE